MYFMRFFPCHLGDLVTRTGEWEIWSVSGRLLDNPGELALILFLVVRKSDICIDQIDLNITPG